MSKKVKEDSEEAEVEVPKPSGIKENYDLENAGDLFEFIQKVAFPGMPLEMVSILSKQEIGMCMRLADAIWFRMDLEMRFKAKTQLPEYVVLLREYLRFATSYKGEARRQLMETAIAGMPRIEEKKGWFGRKKD